MSLFLEKIRFQRKEIRKARTAMQDKKKSGELLAEKSFTEWQIRSQPF